jgi:hypothetical protein
MPCLADTLHTIWLTQAMPRRADAIHAMPQKMDASRRTPRACTDAVARIMLSLTLSQKCHDVVAQIIPWHNLKS